jgi:hypothetical protein
LGEGDSIFFSNEKDEKDSPSSRGDNCKRVKMH